MNTKLPIPNSLLTTAIQDHYAIPVHDLKFRAEGWGGYSYIVSSVQNERFFLKLQNETHTSGIFAANSPEFYMPLMHQLHTRHIVNLPELILTQNGDFSAQVAEFKIMVYRFIEGQEVGFGNWPVAILPKLAEQVGKLHNALPKLEIKHPFVENFQIAFENEIIEYLHILETTQPSIAKGRLKLQAALLPRQEAIRQQLSRLKELQAILRQQNPKKVICHTDLHGANLMTGVDGKLYLLDWENAMIAPPEHDLFFWVGEDQIWDVFFPIYQKQVGAVKLSHVTFEFYFLRRALEDIADFILSILREDGSDDRDSADLREVLICLNGLPAIPTTIARMQARNPALFR